ncbi:MAG: hypothetical protein KatS3mg009_2907 [Acidimicrobiia bacterium]|nr:MAG: hypothetical protein KatS3mg009_2907 [Acidimicrobiia bacterium]
MDDLRERLERLATRGRPRGADAVLAAALAEAGRRAGGPDAPGGRAGAGAPAVRPATPAPGEGAAGPVPSVAMEPGPGRRGRHPWRSVVAAAGLAALLGVGTLGIASLLSGGGAASPEAAVRRLADAVAAEDPLAAVGALAPAEVQGLRDAVGDAARRAEEVRLVEDASAPFAGVDVTVTDLDLSSEELAPGFAKVTLHAGRLDAQARREDVSELVREAWHGDDDAVWHGTLDTAEADVDVQPFVIAVRERGGWYVSPAYTALEWLRVLNDLPAADLGSGRAAAPGAESPEGAVRGALDALAANDWDRLWAYATPDQLPLYDYRDALRELLADERFEFTVDTFSATTDVDGDVARVSVTASGTYSDGGRWYADPRCVRWQDGGAPASPPGCAGPAGDPYGPWLAVGATHDGTATVVRSVPVTVVRRDGRWFVSAMATVTEVIRAGVAGIDEQDVFGLLGLEHLLEPDGELELGRSVTLPPGVASTYVYEFEGRAGRRVVGETVAVGAPAGSGRAMHASSVILDPGGEEVPGGSAVFAGFPVELPSDGRYRIVVRPDGDLRVRFTLYDADAAPAGVVDPGWSPSGCNPGSAAGCVAPRPDATPDG